MATSTVTPETAARLAREREGHDAAQAAARRRHEEQRAAFLERQERERQNGAGTAPPSGGETPEQRAAREASERAAREEAERTARNGQNAMDFILANMPWVARLGLGDLVRGWATQGMSAEGMVVALRATSQYKDIFRFIRRADGTMRMNEASYLDREEEYRGIGLEFGKQWSRPEDFGGFFENEIDPNELRDRFKLYSDLEHGTEEERAAFYVYAGMKVSTDDLYEAAVDPKRARELATTYTQRIAAANIDWDTWVQRATEAGLDRVARTLTRLEEAGVTNANQVVRQVGSIDPAFSRQMIEQLYVGAGQGGRLLALNELMNAFEYAMLGSAASAQGLALPDAERLETFRQAGITRARALELYGQFGRNKNLYEGAVQRSGRATSFGQADFEDAVFLNNADQSAVLERAMAFEEGLGKVGGSFAFGRNQAGRVVQSGLSSQLT